MNLFHYLTGHSHAPECSTLLVAPTTMRKRILELIKRETENKVAGRPARIVAKMNQLEDPEMIEAFCEASEAGVPIDLSFAASVACARALRARRRTSGSVPSSGDSSNTRVFSILPTEKENPIEGDFFIGSADWMFRNLSKRVEVVTPVFATGPKEKLWEVLEICLHDHRQAWVLGPNGRYTQLQPKAEGGDPQTLGTHQTLMNLTRSRLGA